MISVTILTKNSQRWIQKVLAALVDFSEVVVLDTGSTDQTLKIASQFSNVRIFEDTFTGFGQMHNKASSLATHSWILSVDSDEVPSEELVDEILSLELHPSSVYTFPRRNYLNGKFIRRSGWYPDRVVRLYNRNATGWTDAHVHEGVITEGMYVVPLQGHVDHYSYEQMADFLQKMQSYSDLFASQHAGHRKSSLTCAIWHSAYAFLKTWIFKRGILDGREGFIISAYNATTAFYKYLKLEEANQAQRTLAISERDGTCSPFGSACGLK